MTGDPRAPKYDLWPDSVVVVRRALDVRQSTKLWNQISNARARCAEGYTNSKNQLQPEKRTTVRESTRVYAYRPSVGRGGLGCMYYATLLQDSSPGSLGPIHCSQTASVLPG